ncbi:phospholipid-binding protein, PBP family [Richelia sinica FACHB-800]|uniref:Phospholipid-binding protein, PBP family n=1 Tax=Richelia sinica FACHB-800 TaxID=1357546 RepID=A0A975Y622_9NOST|nr:YbhB/YbcL family Raf kinase inhibitor-like protein [Richelia sinica]MBD2665616.1 YbhB/YbcL family Raf kinase inhibitor-like protein [Richelia sinica FACHB-800]QXE24809.1 phospholipid-binding protein, PBP family [Richelia sinica FACHB-800]
MSRMRAFLPQSFSIIGLVELSAIACSSVGNKNTEIASTPSSKLTTKGKSMKLESVFGANSQIPAKYTCDGADISPTLSWDEPPKETQSLALIVDDPDAPRHTFVHWVLYDIPPTVRQLPEHITATKTLPNGGVQGKNDFGKLGYGGPCPPSGTHRYFFKLYALDKNLGLPPGATKEQILQAMKGHVLATAELIGRYQRQR